MPGSNQRHVLAILRRTLRLTQAELAEIGLCKPVTIQAIELLKLKLSERLAARIAFETGCNIDWLLENDINKPMPPIRPLLPPLNPKLHAKGLTFMVLWELFQWLIAIAIRQPKDTNRRTLELFLGMMVDHFKKAPYDPKALPAFQTDAFEFVVKHRELFDQDLVNIINFDFLAADPRTQLDFLKEKKKSRGPKFTPQQPVSAKEPPSRVRKARSRARR